MITYAVVCVRRARLDKLWGLGSSQVLSPQFLTMWFVFVEHGSLRCGELGSLQVLSPLFLTLVKWARPSTKLVAIVIFEMVSGSWARLAVVLGALHSIAFLNPFFFVVPSAYRARLTVAWWARLCTWWLPRCSTL